MKKREYQQGERFFDKKSSRLITIIRCVSYNDVYTATVVPTDPEYIGPYSYTEMFHGYELAEMEYLGN